jgi:hypothetical protein
MQEKTRENYGYNKWDFFGPCIPATVFGFCAWGDGDKFCITMALMFAAMAICMVITNLLKTALVLRVNQEPLSSKERKDDQKPIKQTEKKPENQVQSNQSLQRLGRDYVNRTILIGFDNISVAEACLEFFKKHGIKLHEPYDRLYAALSDPFWDKKTAERIFDFMNRIAPEGSEFRELNKNAWGFA